MPKLNHDGNTPYGCCTKTWARIKRIEAHHGVVGVMHLENDVLKMYTIEETLAHLLALKLPIINSATRHAITELDILNELVAYRIETKKYEIIVAPDSEFTAAVIHTVKKSKFKGKNKNSK